MIGGYVKLAERAVKALERIAGALEVSKVKDHVVGENGPVECWCRKTHEVVTRG